MRQWYVIATEGGFHSEAAPPPSTHADVTEQDAMSLQVGRLQPLPPLPLLGTWGGGRQTPQQQRAAAGFHQF